jgi:hypothetical protein
MIERTISLTLEEAKILYEAMEDRFTESPRASPDTIARWDGVLAKLTTAFPELQAPPSAGA